ncbi:baseplate assembly protein [Stutzerimonas kirkiae]|uniref:baseplate assembly protein n=1 Tax=Stutzerimonas kirkiae TaxID=2211392 RepID=UPI0010383C1B|nr:baseplate J/gp47 family protein [Stutzerimonas kirkiae]TBV10270.1 baseplate protein [Stutzerimonas kirkiae]
MRDLPAPEFVQNDPAAIEAELVARYESAAGKSLYPAQIERLFINQIAYAKSRILAAIQNAGEMLLVRTSSAPMLDYLGELVSTPRLLAKAATCTQAFTLPAVQAGDVVLPVGTRVSTADGRVTFATQETLTIASGQLQVRATVVCTTAGIVGNGWGLGQLSVLGSAPLAGMATANETVTADGADDETDAAYKERIILAPEAYSNAGSRGAYRYHVRAVHQSIIDVAVLGPDDEGGPADGHVAIYPLTTSGLPTAQLLEDVATAVSGEKVRPLCDTVLVHSPVEVPYVIEAQLTLYTWAAATFISVQAACQAAVEAYAARMGSALGNDIVPEQVIAALQGVAGVKRAALLQPAAVLAVAGQEWAHCTGIHLSIVGYEND